MISTVTFTTISKITAIGSEALGRFAIILLIILLSTKELTGDSDKGFYKILNKVLTVGIAPLLIVFVITLVTKILEVLSEPLF